MSDTTWFFLALGVGVILILYGTFRWYREWKKPSLHIHPIVDGWGLTYYLVGCLVILMALFAHYNNPG